ncbi:MAG: DUF1989 domain-containing protein [Mycobacterium sp.]|nr:DUF1989 domain-containing protein [Mycobacterium sp.]
MLAADLTEWLSAAVTRGVKWRLSSGVGESFFGTAYRPLLTFERDDSPSRHNMQFAPCSADMYTTLEHPGYHRSCGENFRQVAAQVG